MNGDAGWDCARWSKPLSLAEQDEGCPAHLYIPALVPGTLEEVDEEAETIRYTLTNGDTWIDGATEKNSAAA